jgi:hypothetical protein
MGPEGGARKSEHLGHAGEWPEAVMMRQFRFVGGSPLLGLRGAIAIGRALGGARWDAPCEFE